MTCAGYTRFLFWWIPCERTATFIERHPDDVRYNVCRKHAAEAASNGYTVTRIDEGWWKN